MPNPVMSQKMQASLTEEMIRRGLMAPPPKPRSEWEIAELERCKNDVVYFIRQYCWTFDPFLRYGQAFIKFDPFPLQEEAIAWLQERLANQEDGLIEKSRDSGASYIVLYFFLHQWLFTEGFAAGVGSNKLDSVDNMGDPKSLFEKLRICLRKLPNWLLPPGFLIKKHAGLAKLINPNNGSTIIGEGGENIGRGGRTSIYLVDEAAFLDNPDSADASLFQTTRCRIYVSTPFGRNSFFAKRKRMKRFKMHWIDDPRKNRWEVRTLAGVVVDSGVGRIEGIPIPDADTPKWTDGEFEVIYPWYFTEHARERKSVVAQEIDINYLGSGNPVFDNKFLFTLNEDLVARDYAHRLYFEEASRTEWGADVSTFKEAERDGYYVVIADVAEGLNKDGEHDWSVAHVYDLSNWEQVLHYRGRPDTHFYAEDLANLGSMYNNAMIVVERNGPGLSVLNSLMNSCGYHNIYYHQDFDDSGKALTSLKPGWPATRRSRKESINDLDSFITNMANDELGFIWNEPNTVEELMSFVKKPGMQMEADSGSHDDEVTVCRIASIIMPMYSRRRLSGVERPKRKFQPLLSNTSRLVHV